MVIFSVFSVFCKGAWVTQSAIDCTRSTSKQLLLAIWAPKNEPDGTQNGPQGHAKRYVRGTCSRTYHFGRASWHTLGPLGGPEAKTAAQFGAKLVHFVPQGVPGGEVQSWELNDANFQDRRS